MSINEFILVTMFSTGTIFIWSIFDIVEGLGEPRLCIENTGPSWKTMTLSDTKIAFGLDFKFGDFKIYSFSDEHPTLTGSDLKDEDGQDGSQPENPKEMEDFLYVGSSLQ